MKVRYIKDGKWVKEGTKGAEVWGIQEGRKMRKVNLETLQPYAYRKKNRKPTLSYREGGKYLKKEAAELLLNTKQFKDLESKRLEKFEQDREKFNSFGQTSAFYDLTKDFKGAFVEPFGFKKLILTRIDPVTGKTIEKKEIKSLASAQYELTQRGYEAAKIAKEANDKGESTPPDIFNIPISMGEDGEYLIETRF